MRSLSSSHGLPDAPAHGFCSGHVTPTSQITIWPFSTVFTSSYEHPRQPLWFSGQFHEPFLRNLELKIWSGFQLKPIRNYKGKSQFEGRPGFMTSKVFVWTVLPVRAGPWVSLMTVWPLSRRDNHFPGLLEMRIHFTLWLTHFFVFSCWKSEVCRETIVPWCGPVWHVSIPPGSTPNRQHVSKLLLNSDFDNRLLTMDFLL